MLLVGLLAGARGRALDQLDRRTPSTTSGSTASTSPSSSSSPRCIYGLAGYFAFGALVYLGEQLAGGLGSYRRARHLLAFACAPLALSLVVWPVRLALYGEDNFRSGGSDSGTGGSVFEGIEAAVDRVVRRLCSPLGIKQANGWTWRARAARRRPCRRSSPPLR